MRRIRAGYLAGWLGSVALASGCVPPEAAVATQQQALLGQSGDHTVSGQETLNQYAVLAADAPAGSTSLALQDVTPLGGLKAGDVLFIIQMQGAAVDLLSDASRYGDIVDIQKSGHYELLTVTAVDASTNRVSVRSHAAKGSQFDYSAAGHTQILSVPQYGNLIVPSATTLTAPAWNGSSGGVVVVSATSVQVDGTITASGLGFRGGQTQNGLGNANYFGYRTSNGQLAGERGEGVGGSASDYDAINGRFGRGAAGNGGGGGNQINSPGGGGANGLASGKRWSGQGVMDPAFAAAWLFDPAYVAGGNSLADSAGGGRGGYGNSTANLDPTVSAPGLATWGGGTRQVVGGLGGRPVPNDVRSRLFFGGGGGAGQADNSNAGAGGSGGGVVFILAGSIAGQGQISADGSGGGNTGSVSAVAGDGPGGGGGGGSIVLMAAQSIGAVQLSASGGIGGNHVVRNVVNEGAGGGGGGGGGFIATVGQSSAVLAVKGGKSGTTNQTIFTKMPTDGATDGASGTSSQVASFGPDFLPPVQAVDLQITLGLGSTQRPGYTSAPVYATVTNLGPDTANNLTTTINLPSTPAVVPGIVTRSADYSCTQAGQVLTCTLASLAPGSSEVVEIYQNLPATSGTYQVSGAVSGGGIDYVPTNNQATLGFDIVGHVQFAGDGFGCTVTSHRTERATIGWAGLSLLLLVGVRRRRLRRLVPAVALFGLAGCSPPTVLPLNVQVTLTGSGTVSSVDGAIACGSQCQTAVSAGTRMRLVATPADGQRFVKWDGRCQGTVPSCDLIVENDTPVTASFEPIPASCFDGQQGASESDVDCGGPCAPCADGQRCQAASDCGSSQCLGNLCSSCPIGKELIINPDAESAPAMAGWQVTGTFTTQAYGGGGFPLVTDPGPPVRGSVFFYGGNSATSSAQQSLDLRACSALIDQGKIGFQLSGYLGGFAGDNDNAVVSSLFQDSQQNTLSSGKLGPVLVVDRGGKTGLLFRTAMGSVAVGTRAATINIACTRTAGISDDCYSDNLSLMLSFTP